jgi:pimeloyl-ACP methyl ester carboxylesterase
LKQRPFRRVLGVLCTSLAVAASSFAQSAPLWGELQPGPEAVGFQTVLRFDSQRTWTRTYDSAGRFVPDVHGRPVQVSLWYPAKPTGQCKGMSFGTLIDADNDVPPGALADFVHAMRARSREDARTAVPAERLEALRGTPMRACAGAPAAGSDASLVLYAGGLNAPITSNVVLAEYLASHGFVFASISLIGATDGQVSQTRSPIDVEGTVRDLEFASTVARELGLSRGVEVAVAGHSLGAVAAMIFAARHGNTRAVIGLDGTHGFEGSTTLLAAGFGYEPLRMRAHVLDIRRAEGQQDARLDLTPIRAMRHARRELVTVDAMHHSDFTSFAMIADRFLTPTDIRYAGTGWDRRTARLGYELSARLILELLSATLKADGSAMDRFAALTRGHGAARWTTLAASPMPPSPEETSLLMMSHSGEQVRERFRGACADRPPAECVDAERFNAFGYALLGKQMVREAIGVLELVAWAHPRLANAQDSLADAYLAAGDRERARQALRRAIEIAPADSSLRPAERERSIAAWAARIRELP